SGTHSYLVRLGRGRWQTLGTVATLTPEKARVAATAALSNVERDTLKHLSDDPSLNLRGARAKAREAIRAGLKKQMTWSAYLDEQYEPFVLANRKSGADLIARLRVTFGAFNDMPLTEISA